MKNNYIASLLICISCTILSALGHNSDWHWLLVSDANVAVFLLLAHLMDRDKR
ncbi:hypothetical protein [Mariprofundus ferrooxydans]|uniref:hypothetical protein n=1 Tax=Mariprofundus ferrooxydans TaxID=314344 RepID=UPI0012DF7641|nr:hypothetical protein [Mariprofundus ferrooxydans]